MRPLALALAAVLACLPLAARAEGGTIWTTGYSCPPYCGLTASGVPVGPGVAACPSWMPFGTVLRVEGIGTVTCWDRGPDWLDLWFPTLAECYRITGLHAYEVVG